MVEFTSEAIENAIWQINAAPDGGVTIEEIAKNLGKLPEDEVEQDELLSRVAREADSSGRFFKKDGKYVIKADFFNGQTFIITPSDLEIEEKILFPGHRFAPFCSSDVYISDVVLMPENGRAELKIKEIECDFHELLGIHALLGSGQIYDLVVAEHPENVAFLRGERNAKVKMCVFDMAAFYRKNNFSGGDALLVTIEDYNEGEFIFSFIPASERNEESRDLWIRKYENALSLIIPLNSDYEEMPGLLADAMFEGGKELFGKDGASLDEFISLSGEIELRAGDDGDGTYLAVRDGVTDNCCSDGEHTHRHGGDAILPDGISISGGTLDSIPAILKELGLTLTPTELDAFIFDNYSNSDYDPDALYRHLFGDTKFADDAQEALFRVLFEEHFEDLQPLFDRNNDEEVRELRGEILAQVDSRLTLLSANLILSEAELKIVAECTIFFNELLVRIHTPGYNREEDPLREEMLEIFEDFVQKQEDVINLANGLEQ